jgi:hypothetical protein
MNNQKKCVTRSYLQAIKSYVLILDSFTEVFLQMRGVRSIMERKDGPERIRKEELAACYKILSQRVLGGPQETYGTSGRFSGLFTTLPIVKITWFDNILIN